MNIRKIHTKYAITDSDLLGITAEVSESGISFKNKYGKKEFIFERSDREIAERIIRMMLKAFELK